MSHYLQLANTERVIITHRSGNSYELLPKTQIVDNDTYYSNPAVIENLRQAELDIAEGRSIELTSEEVAKMLGVWDTN
ncbi:MAG: hypothetical protein LBV38_02225 [Alistipes sp.]|nr:hypothetical protein [Alistipes sp.]